MAWGLGLACGKVGVNYRGSKKLVEHTKLGRGDFGRDLVVVCRVLIGYILCVFFKRGCVVPPSWLYFGDETCLHEIHFGGLFYF